MLAQKIWAQSLSILLATESQQSQFLRYLYTITLSAVVVLDKWKSDGYKRPKPVMVRRKDSGVVTIGDVVEQLSPHFMAHKKGILEAKAHFLKISPKDIPTDTRVFFDQFLGIITPGLSHLGVELWAEGEEGKSVEQYFN
jgi:hypothetical protein